MEPNKCNYENIYLNFPMVFKSLVSLGKSRCDIFNGITQGWVCPPLVSSIN
jgi:hypothetical protein